MFCSFYYKGLTTVGQQAPIRDFNKKKYFLPKKIIHLLVLGLKRPPMGQKPAFLTYLMIFFSSKILPLKGFEGCRKLL